MQKFISLSSSSPDLDNPGLVREPTVSRTTAVDEVLPVADI